MAPSARSPSNSNSNRKTYGSLTFTVPSGSDKTSAVGSTAVTYDAAGNITGVGADAMTYNQANQLATITTSATWTNKTDAFGRRLTSSGSTIHATYAYGQSGAVIFESRTGNAELNYVWLDPDAGGAESYMPVAVITPSTAAVNALHFDRLGSPLKATNPSKTIVYNLVPNPNGAGTPSPSTLPVALRWPGQINDNTGMFNNGYRTYLDFTFPTYLQPDPIGLAGGMNPYIYGGMNLFVNTDPSGLCFGPLFFLLPACAEAAAAVEANAPWLLPLATGVTQGILGFYAEGGGADAAPEVTPGATCTVSGAETGDHIVLGLANQGLEQAAAQVGGRTLLSDPNWMTTLQSAIGNQSTKFTINLNGLSGTTPYSQLMIAAQKGVSGVDSGYTNWEIGQLYQANRLGEANLIQNGVSVPNPLAP